MTRTARRPLALLLTTPLLLLAACGGSDSTDSSAAGDTAASAAPVATKAAPAATKAAKSSRCETVSQALLDGIASGAEDGVGKLTLSNGAAVRSKDYSEVYLVAAKLTAPGVDGDIGVWATNSLTAGGGLIMSVDGFAKQFTVWPDADKTDAEISLSADGYDEARDCIG